MSFRTKTPRSFPVLRMNTPSPDGQSAPEALIPAASPVSDQPIPAEMRVEHGPSGDEYYSDEEAFESSQPAAFHAAEQSLTALPSMDKSPEKLRPSQESDMALHLNKNLPPSPPKRLFRFFGERESSARANTNTTATNKADVPITSRGRRVMTNVGGGLRALRLLSRSHADLRRESSQAAASSTHLHTNVPACQPRGASQLACALALESFSVASATSSKASSIDAGFLQFPPPPGHKVEDAKMMRVRASLENEVESEEDEQGIPLGPFGRSSISLPRTRGRQQQQLAELEVCSRSSSMETVIRRPRASSTETVERAARRASIPARLPLSPVILGQPIVTASPLSATITMTDEAATAANVCRIRRKRSRNFSRPFAASGQRDAGGSGEKKEQEVEVEEETVGLAISMGPSPIKPLQQHEQSASHLGDTASPVDDAPADWPLRKMRSFVRDAALDKSLPALPEEQEE